MWSAGKRMVAAACQRARRIGRKIGTDALAAVSDGFDRVLEDGDITTGSHFVRLFTM